jgi:hypothetical protein
MSLMSFRLLTSQRSVYLAVQLHLLLPNLDLRCLLGRLQPLGDPALVPDPFPDPFPVGPDPPRVPTPPNRSPDPLLLRLHYLANPGPPFHPGPAPLREPRPTPMLPQSLQTQHPMSRVSQTLPEAALILSPSEYSLSSQIVQGPLQPGRK